MQDELPEESVWTSSAAHSRSAPLVVVEEPPKAELRKPQLAALVALHLVWKVVRFVGRNALAFLRLPYLSIDKFDAKDVKLHQLFFVIAPFLNLLFLFAFRGKIEGLPTVSIIAMLWFQGEFTARLFHALGVAFVRGLKEEVVKATAEVEKKYQKPKRFKPG